MSWNSVIGQRRVKDLLVSTLKANRLAHAYVHVTSNDVNVRGPVFGIGFFVLAIMWLIFMVRIMLGLP